MGGQRFGEMEVWGLEAYGAGYTLQELVTVKSDAVEARLRAYELIVTGENLLWTRVPESYNVLEKEIRGLGIDMCAVSAEEE